MTLNITVLTREYIYQSADFRLTNSDTGELITDRSGKTVSLNYQEWSGFVTYTGLGRWEGCDISAHVADWLGDGVDRAMSEVADHIAEQGTRLLTEVRRHLRRWMTHTFTLAGFENGTARAFVISNFEDCFGAEHAVQPTLTVTSRALGTRHKGTVIVTGRKKAVPSSDRSVLGNLAARYPADGGRIRRRMQALNAKAAASPASCDAVSPDCVVLSFRSDGSGVLQLSDDAAAGPAQFPQVTYGRNTAKMLDDVFKTLGIDPTRVPLVQGASSSVRASGPRSRPGLPCAFAVQAPDASSSYSLTEITAPDFEPLSARDISDSGHVVGTGRPSPGTVDSIPWMFSGGRIQRLGYTGTAQAVNSHGHVVGTTPGESGESGVFCAAGAATALPCYHGPAGEFAGTDSAAFAINAADLMGGSVRSRTEERGRPNTRAAAWEPGGAARVLLDVEATFGCRAIAINKAGQVLIMAAVGTFDVRSILWTPVDGAWRYVGDDRNNVFPVALTDDGTVLGQARNNRADPVAVICSPGGRWERLGTAGAWVPIDMNNAGEIVGWSKLDGLQRPWLRRPSGEIVWLPFAIEHHTTPSAMNGSGQIAGVAVADHGTHAVIWNPYR